MMGLYRFTLNEGDTTSSIHMVDLNNLDHAKTEALRFAGEILRECDHQFFDLDEWRVHVADETGMTLFSVEVVATVAPCLKK